METWTGTRCCRRALTIIHYVQITMVFRGQGGGANWIRVKVKEIRPKKKRRQSRRNSFTRFLCDYYHSIVIIFELIFFFFFFCCVRWFQKNIWYFEQHNVTNCFELLLNPIGIWKAMNKKKAAQSQWNLLIRVNSIELYIQLKVRVLGRKYHQHFRSIILFLSLRFNFFLQFLINWNKLMYCLWIFQQIQWKNSKIQQIQK